MPSTPMRRASVPLCALILTTAVFCGTAYSEWFKGVTHVHSLWSDGDASPETIAAWYKERDYNFVCFSEHWILQEGVKFVDVGEGGDVSPRQLESIRSRFGKQWTFVSTDSNGARRMRLKTHSELSEYFNEPDKFLLVPAQEITSSGTVAHTNVVNVRESIPGGEGSVRDNLQYQLDAVAAQSERLGVPMIAHVNHLNWSAGITSEDMISLRGLRFFEIYNGHSYVHTWGRAEAGMPSNDRHWDIIQSMRLNRDATAPLVYGVSTDDSHNYHAWGPEMVNPGRGWVVVRADSLESKALVEAMQAGDFYGSTGVTLRDIQLDATSITISIAAEDGVSYTTRFIGTRENFDNTSTPKLDAAGNALPRATRRYSSQVGATLQESKGSTAAYVFTGDELYVRAVVTSDRAHNNPVEPDEVEMAWVQPVRVR